jgi:glycine dehydrogenase
MLQVVGAASLDALIDEAIPDRIRLKQPLDSRGQAKPFLRDLAAVAARNQVFRSFIGLGTTTRSRPA